MAPELIMLRIPGVQQFISESRRTADLRAGSDIVSGLARVAATYLFDNGAEMIFPHPDAFKGDGLDLSVSNRVVAQVDGVEVGKDGAELARGAADAVQQEWRKRARRIFKAAPAQIDTPGFPEVRWVVVPGDESYAHQWKRAECALGALKSATPFEQMTGGGNLCDLSPRWPALDQNQMHPRLRNKPGNKGAKLAIANWVKRDNRFSGNGELANGRFPSTRSIASAPARQKLLELLEEGDSSVRSELEELRKLSLSQGNEGLVGGINDGRDEISKWLARNAALWLDPEFWDRSTLKREFPGDHLPSDVELERGRVLAIKLRKRVEEKEVKWSNYLAFVVQDIDDLGKKLAGDSDAPPTPKSHQDMSERISWLAKEQVKKLSTPTLLATPVYSGGDDLAFFVPAQNAFDAALIANQAVRGTSKSPNLELTASTAIVFFHQSEPLSPVIRNAHDLLGKAKEFPGKNALGVAFQRHSGSTREVVLPWLSDEKVATEMLKVFGKPGTRIVSPKLITEIERDEKQLVDIRGFSRDLYRAELTRMIKRHASEESSDVKETVDRLDQLANMLARDTGRIPLADALKIAHIIGQEAS